MSKSPFSTVFTTKELKEALRSVMWDLDTAVRLNCPDAIRHTHILRTALRRWINDRKEKAATKGTK